MNSFDSEWLRLRNSADVAARSRSLTLEAARLCGNRETVSVIDLGSGTGANLRYLLPHLAARQFWTLMDIDPGLLDAVWPASQTWCREHGYHCGMLADRIHIAQGKGRTDVMLELLDLSDPLALSSVSGHDLVTTSALLDLVSADWLDRLSLACAETAAIVLCALTYDGRMVMAPEVADDALINTLVNQHQRTDKGFGVALGPDAADYFRRQLIAFGYQTTEAQSDWVLDERHRPLQSRLITEWAAAVQTLPSVDSHRIRRWQQQRLAHVAAGDSTIIVGHTDLLAWPAENRATESD